jgi:L-aminopeptidase/D-esterase-like protein
MNEAVPGGFRVGHWTDRERWTGCTVVLAPEDGVASCEVRGGGPGTRETDLLSPAAAVPGPQAVLLTGGSAFGLTAADGVAGWHEERGLGFPTRVAKVPLVPAAVVYDLALGDPRARPDAAAGYAACEAAAPELPERGSVGVGTGCSVGKLLGMEHATKGGVGYASAEIHGGATVAALAAVNALGEVLAEDGSVLAGIWESDAYVRSSDLLRERGARRALRLERRRPCRHACRNCLRRRRRLLPRRRDERRRSARRRGRRRRRHRRRDPRRREAGNRGAGLPSGL